MRARSLVFGALGAAFMLGAVAPAYADRDDWRHHDERGDHDRYRGHGGDWHQGYDAPPVVVSPPAYYAPPPVVYSPGITFGFTVR